MFNKVFKTSVPSWIILALIGIIILGVILALNYVKNIGADQDLLFLGDKGNGQKFEYGSWPELSNTDFFNEVKNKFIAEKKDFIESDLSKMELRVYLGGEVKKQVNILSKGREGSWWETPAGLYRVEGKEKNHFSSFGQVYMPWSMPFQGNFFIHGWPYYPGGEPVDSTYSGGCIRLATEDAKAVFDLVKSGVPVLVYDDGFKSDEFKYNFMGPQISANNFLAADLGNNFVFLEKNSTATVPIASITKLITAVVATEYINLEKELTVPEAAKVYTSKSRLKPGEKVSLFDLLHLLLLESSNEAAITIANHLGPKRFVELMNLKAAALGMKNSKFVDSSGKEPENISSAEDLFVLSKYLFNNRSFILKISAGNIKNSAYGQSLYQDLENFNVFQDDPDFIGGKVGQTIEAGQTILSIFETELNGQKRAIVIIALGSLDRVTDAKQMIEYVRYNY